MKRVANSRGFTLLEVLVAITLLAIGLLAVAGMQTTAFTGNMSARDVTTAVQLAEEMVDRIRANAGNDPSIYNISTSGVCTGFSEPAKGDCTQWQSRLQISESGLANAVGTVVVQSGQPIGNTATVTVTVTWGGGRTVSFKTILETWGT